jgi:hypothetical protein
MDVSSDTNGAEWKKKLSKKLSQSQFSSEIIESFNSSTYHKKQLQAFSGKALSF